MVRCDLVFKEALLFSFIAGNLAAQLFDRGDCFEKILACAIRLIECKVSFARYCLRVPQEIGNAGLNCKGSGALGVFTSGLVLAQPQVRLTDAEEDLTQ